MKTMKCLVVVAILAGVVTTKAAVPNAAAASTVTKAGLNVNRTRDMAPSVRIILRESTFDVVITKKEDPLAVAGRAQRARKFAEYKRHAEKWDGVLAFLVASLLTKWLVEIRLPERIWSTTCQLLKYLHRGFFAAIFQ